MPAKQIEDGKQMSMGHSLVSNCHGDTPEHKVGSFKLDLRNTDSKAI